jgi:hypothetical protein
MGSGMFEGARTAPMMARGAQILRSLAPSQFADQIPTNLQLPPGQPPSGGDPKRDSPTQPIYNQRQNDAMQRLIDAASRK